MTGAGGNAYEGAFVREVPVSTAPVSCRSKPARFGSSAPSTVACVAYSIDYQSDAAVGTGGPWTASLGTGGEAYPGCTR